MEQIAFRIFKATTNMLKPNGKISSAIKDFSSKSKIPENILKITNSRNGLYKLSPEEKVIDALKGVKDQSGKIKFSEDALKAEIKKVNWGFMRNKDIAGQYSDKRCYEIAKFAERTDVNLKDVAEFSLLPENSFGFANSLSNDRFKIFKEFMRYTECDQLNFHQIGESNIRRFSYKQLLHIAKDMPDEQIHSLKKLLNIKRPDGPFVFKDEFVFGGNDLIKLAQNKDLDINAVAKFAKTSGLNGFSITEMAKVKDMDFNRATNVINQIKKSHKGNVIFSVEKDLYEADKFRLLEWNKSNDKQIIIKTFDNKMNLISTDKIIRVPGKENQARIIGKDFDVVLQAHSVPRKDIEPLTQKVTEVISETRQIRDSSGNLLRTEILSPSKVEGLHNWKAVMPDGTVKPLIDVKMSKSGILTVKKDLEALDGTITKQNYKKLPNGSWTMRLNISKGGKVLSKRNIKHKIISENEAESIINGQKYKVLYSPNEIKLLNSRGDIDCTINLSELIDSNNLPENAIKLKNMLKECSADELQVISKKLKKLEFNKNKMDAYAELHSGTVSCQNDIFIFRHEMGHIDDLFGTAPTPNMDYQGIYSTADDFKKIYFQELNLFMKQFPQTQRAYVDYFIDHTDPELTKRSLQETVAELLASNKSPDINRLIGTRTEYMERYFPKTRSYLVNA